MNTPARPKVLAVIPARYESSRFPAKMIANLKGKPLVYHTYARACEATLVDEVVVAADDERIVEALAPHGVRVILTSPDHHTGTDRVAEAAALSDADIIVNVQGDEPLLDPRVIDETVRPLLDDPTLPMATACRRMTELADMANPNVVKVIIDQRGRALYFSRLPIPYVRDTAAHPAPGAPCYQHIGLYVFRRDFLLTFASLPQTPLEMLEKLEQLRVLEHGYDIAVVETTYLAIGVDTPQDLERVRKLMA
jgi:3-deoxy-manno-octulosonate cytidylyltransferase (CMP-KDO synthetase)